MAHSVATSKLVAANANQIFFFWVSPDFLNLLFLLVLPLALSFISLQKHLKVWCGEIISGQVSKLIASTGKPLLMVFVGTTLYPRNSSNKNSLCQGTVCSTLHQCSKPAAELSLHIPELHYIRNYLDTGGKAKSWQHLLPLTSTVFCLFCFYVSWLFKVCIYITTKEQKWLARSCDYTGIYSGFVLSAH